MRATRRPTKVSELPNHAGIVNFGNRHGNTHTQAEGKKPNMAQLHINGSVFDLDEDQSVADIFNFLNNYTKEQDGQTWLKLADGGTVHFQFGGPPTFAVVVPEGYKPEGLKVSRSPRH